MRKNQHDDAGGCQGFAGAFCTDGISWGIRQRKGRGGETDRAVVGWNNFVRRSPDEEHTGLGLEIS